MQDREEGFEGRRRRHLDRPRRRPHLAARADRPQRRSHRSRRRHRRRVGRGLGRRRRGRASRRRRASASVDEQGGIEIKLPPGADSEAVREAVEEARAAVIEAIRESQEKAIEARAGSRGRARGGGRRARLGRREGRPHRQADARPQARRLPHRPGVADHHRVGDPEDHLQADHPGRGEGRRRDRDRRLRAAQAPGRRGAHGGDAGAGRAALPVQHARLDRPPDRDRSAAREHDAEEPDRAAARVDAVDARVEPGAARRSAARWR